MESDEYIDVLRQHHLQFRTSLNFKALHPYLNRYGLIPLDHQEDFVPVLPPVTNSDQIDRLLVWLPQCGQPDYVHKLIQCLRDSSEDAGDAHNELADALQKAMEQHPQVTGMPTGIHRLHYHAREGDLSPDVLADSPMYADSIALLPMGNMRDLRKQKPPSRVMKGKCCSLKWIGCYIVLMLPVVLMLILLIILSRVPATDDSVHPVIAVQYDTVELQFNLPSLWLSRATLSINIADGFTGTLFTIKGTSCSELPTVMNIVNRSVPYEFYLLPRSMIHFTISMHTNSSVPVWIIWDFNLYRQYNPDRFLCNSAPPGSFCFEARTNLTSFQYHVTKAGYFNIIANRAQVQWHFERYLYNYSEIALLYKPIATLNDGDRGSKTIQVTSPFDFQSVCVLLHIDPPPTHHLDDGTFGQLKGSSIRRNDILLFPAITVFVFVAFVLCLIAFHCAHIKRSKKS